GGRVPACPFRVLRTWAAQLGDLIEFEHGHSSFRYRRAVGSPGMSHRALPFSSASSCSRPPASVTRACRLRTDPTGSAVRTRPSAPTITPYGVAGTWYAVK